MKRNFGEETITYFAEEDFTDVVENNNYGDYTKPPIPEGWYYVEGMWYTGYCIQDLKGNQFVWVPVGFLDPNGTLDGKNFSFKFGRRNYCNNEFSRYEFNEMLDEDLLMQWESIKKYGGFYISRYNISKIKKAPQSVKGEMPWTDITGYDAMKAAEGFGNGDSVTSHLPFGAEYDTTLEWYIKSGKKRKADICSDFTNGVDFYEWTQERYNCPYLVIRGVNSDSRGNYYPVGYRDCMRPIFHHFWVGFRAVLCIK